MKPLESIEVASAEVVSVVNDRSSATAFLMVLLYTRVFVVHVQRRFNTFGDDAAPRGSASGNSTIKDQLHMVRAANINILPNYFFKEHAALNRAIKHAS